jgi:hypothetical protein
VVGFYEYAHALENFEELVRLATPEEMTVIQEIIAKRNELALATNLSKNIPHPPNVLDETPLDEDDLFVRRGLEWLMALARVEIASTSSGFTPQKDAFVVVSPTDFELAAYEELVLDGVRSHYWALQNDPDLEAVRKGRVELQRLMAYGRRLFMTREMLSAAEKLLARSDEEARLRELDNWDDYLAGVQSQIVFQINDTVSRAPATKLTHLPCPNLEEQIRMGLNPRGRDQGRGSQGAPSNPAPPAASSGSLLRGADGKPLSAPGAAP